MDFYDEFKPQFIEDAIELIDQFEKDLLELENAPNSFDRCPKTRQADVPCK